MVIGLSGIQFEYFTKSDDSEAGVQFVNLKYDYEHI